MCVCLLTGIWGQTVLPNYEMVEFQDSVSECSNPRLCCLMLCIFPSPFPNPRHIYHTGSSAHMGVPYLCPSIYDFHTRSFSHLGVSRLRLSIPTTHPGFLSLPVTVLLHAHLATAPPPPPFIFPQVIQGGPKLFFRCLLLPPRISPLSPSFIPCLPCTHLK